MKMARSKKQLLEQRVSMTIKRIRLIGRTALPFTLTPKQINKIIATLRAEITILESRMRDPKPECRDKPFSLEDTK